jgi:hypothetical protein
LLRLAKSHWTTNRNPLALAIHKIMAKRKYALTRKQKKLPTKKSWYKRFWPIFWSALVAGGLITGYITFADWAVQKSKPDHEKFIDEYYIKGIAIPPSLKNKEIHFIMGGGHGVGTIYDYAQLLDGVDVTPNLLLFDVKQQSPFDLKFKIINDRLYIRSDFKYILNNELIGGMRYDRWALRKDQMIDYYATDDAFEVRDKQNNVVFNMKIENGQIIFNGYFLTPNGIHVLHNGVKTFWNRKGRDYKKDAQMEIDSIPKLFKGIL